MASAAEAQRNGAIWQSQYLDNQGALANNYLANYYGVGIDQTGQGYDRAKQNLAGAQDNALASLMNGYLGATNDINGQYSRAGQDISAGAASGRDALTSGYGQAGDTIRTGLDSSLGALGVAYGDAFGATNQGIAGYQPWIDAGNSAGGMYMNALGGNGAEGSAAARAAFQTSPGYEWQVSQATDAAARKASALGLTASGNTLDAITRLGSNLADQEYSSWLDRLNGLQAQGLQAVGGQQAGYNALANLNAQYGRDASNVYQGAAGALSGLQTGLGTALSSNYTTEGSQLGTLGQNQGNALAGLTSGYGKSQADTYGQYGQLMASANEAQGNNLASLYAQLGAGSASNLMGVSNTIANTGNQAMAASNSSNQLNNALGVAGLGLKVAGLGTGTRNSTLGGTALKSLFG